MGSGFASSQGISRPVGLICHQALWKARCKTGSNLFARIAPAPRSTQEVFYEVGIVRVVIGCNAFRAAGFFADGVSLRLRHINRVSSAQPEESPGRDRTVGGSEGHV